MRFRQCWDGEGTEMMREFVYTPRTGSYLHFAGEEWASLPVQWAGCDSWGIPGVSVHTDREKRFHHVEFSDVCEQYARSGEHATQLAGQAVLAGAKLVQAKNPEGCRVTVYGMVLPGWELPSELVEYRRNLAALRAGSWGSPRTHPDAWMMDVISQIEPLLPMSRERLISALVEAGACPGGARQAVEFDGDGDGDLSGADLLPLIQREAKAFSDLEKIATKAARWLLEQCNS